MKKSSGHSCRICGAIKPNEAFSGKGHRNHICKSCSSRPQAERDAIIQQEEIIGFLQQSNISRKNMSRLRDLAKSENARTAELAGLVLEVAEVKPSRKRLLKFLAQKSPSSLTGSNREEAFKAGLKNTSESK